MLTKAKIAALAAGISFLALGSAQAVEIEYWQYVFDSRVQAMDKLIANFEAANPGITVKQTTFPYADYQTRVVAAKVAGQGPDVVQLFYGWLDNFVAGGLIQPLDPAVFPHDKIESDFFPIVTAMKRGEDYYGLPTAVRSLALFYNKAIFNEAGIANPPSNLEELLADAKATTKRDGAGNITSAGITMDMAGQDHHWWREVLIRQNGGEPYDAEGNVAYNSEAGAAALKFYTDLQTEHKVGLSGFMDEGQAAFRAGLAAMTIDGTFRLGAFSSNPFEWGVVELPANADGLRSNYSSYFANAIGAGATGEKLEAAQKFLTYITSPEAMEVWLETVGELPARRDVALTEKNLADPILGPFLKGLEYAHTTKFYDEAGQRQVAIDMVNRVLIDGQSIEDSLKQAAEAEQAIIDQATGK
ncbi:extracellular solute-binding protein [Paradevosia shaoguanensis]|uniref:Extracellular solute-binding protein n=1 Tax=Paradevosia shaoguanensis TaxID=1335043 RepID=A0AA41QIN7_9HYPH|nr:extracellular solute-binding protein [Paradevosia shaoguanensis]KFL25649.1 ABC transporter substrate-binding protein [Devosia sp. 17-2-E-8]MBI4048720.1 extracellular solute-binding protein [Devosia nanyangense]QMV03428.1 extracellular solute-binding protein [Devosia sp. D6-9]CDP51536.1 Sugar ABC transporter, periplasmic sugar-binding p rotein USSDB1B [Devosia sp. DBB001]MCF1741157.1 extracellular solute-binding protein [Paradevosia shaoguanensis]